MPAATLMISALVLVPDASVAADEDRTREIVVRSLGWLVSAVVAGAIGDVVLAAPTRLGLGNIADLVGCGLVEDDRGGDLLRRGAEACRRDRLLVMRSGFAGSVAMVDELDTLLRGASGREAALILAEPDGMPQRVMPRLAPRAGITLPRDQALRARSFDDLVRSTRRAPHLRCRATRLL